jgi:hypothetical protein
MKIPNKIILLFLYKTLLYSIAALIINFDLLLAQPSVNIMQNGEFDSGVGGWSLKRLSSANGTIASCDSSVLSGTYSLEAVISSGGDSLHHCRIARSVSLETGRYYSVSFMAAANRSCNIQTVFNTSGSSASTIWEGPIQAVTEAPQHFGPFVFKHQVPEVQRAISFQIGGQNDLTLWIDSVVIEKSDDPEHIRDEEIIVQTVTDTMNNLIANSDNQFLKIHYQSIIDVIHYFLLRYDYSTLESGFVSYTDTNAAWNPKELSTYLERKRPFIISWVSQADGSVSFAQMLPPKNWNPEESYPLYVSLHGLWGVADSPIDYLTYHMAGVINEPFDDGYLLLPWGRGNLWYEGISETDIWDAINKIESIVKVNPEKKYLMGHSMGGYGTWSIGQKSTEVWAAIGVHAGALQWDSYKLLTRASAQKLKNTPVFFICGVNDGFLSLNQTAYQYLHDEGNTRIALETFDGGHDYLYDNLVKINNWIKQWTKPSTGIETGDSKNLTRFKLYDNYPNPFNPSTVISYQLAVGSQITLKVFDVLGNEVATLINEEKAAGDYKFRLDATKYSLSSGIYFYRLQSGKFTETKKLVLIK